MFQLYKTTEGFIITSDDKIQLNDKVYAKTNNIYGGNIVSKCIGFGEYCWKYHIITELTDEKGYHPSHLLKVIAEHENIILTKLKEDDMILINHLQNTESLKIEGHFEDNKFYITKII